MQKENEKNITGNNNVFDLEGGLNEIHEKIDIFNARLEIEKKSAIKNVLLAKSGNKTAQDILKKKYALKVYTMQELEIINKRGYI